MPLALDRDEVALVVLSLAGGAGFTPVQIQKALFLASDEANFITGVQLPVDGGALVNIGH